MEKKRFQDMKNALEDHNYEVIKSIGKGAFGEVVVAKNKKTQRLSAIKLINKVQVRKKPYLRKYIDQEIDIMRKLVHPNIVHYEEQFQTSDFIIIAMEYCQIGNLLTYQAKLPGKTFTLDDSIKVVVEVMKGLKCIHEKDFVHRDIKSENVLLKRGEKNEILYKIADFGFARSICGNAAKTFCGTQKYMAPEIINNSYYGISVDIWALGVLFYFMLFAEYPFKGHDMKAEIARRCTPYFNLADTLTYKEKIKDVTPDTEDFFKRIFVIDTRKRMTFSNITKHPLFIDYAQEFEAHTDFYHKIEKKGDFLKDEIVHDEYGAIENQMEPEDESRAALLRKKCVSNENKHLERELEEVRFEIDKVYYLRECANELFDTYSSYLSFAERLATKFYLLKACLFYANPLLQNLQHGKIPESLQEVGIEPHKWNECIKTSDFKKYVSKFEEDNMKTRLLYEDTYHEVSKILQHIPIKNFDKGYKLEITEKSFQQMKFAYRSTTSYIFKSIHENKKIDSHLRNKIKMRLFCCHMVNRIFNRKEVLDHFPFFVQWLKKKKIEYPYTFDFVYFKRWIYEEAQENLERNIALLHKTFF